LAITPEASSSVALLDQVAGSAGGSALYSTGADQESMVDSTMETRPRPSEGPATTSKPPEPFSEIAVHRTMICDRVRTEAFRRAIDSVVRPGDVVLDVGAGTGILSLFAAGAGAGRVYAVERTRVAALAHALAAALAHALAAANGVAEIVRVIHGDVVDVELPERVDIIVSEWLGGFGIDEGMLAPVIAARDRWLKPGGAMIPSSVTAWAGLVHDRHLAETVGFLRNDPYGVRLDALVEMTLNEVIYSGSSRHLTKGDLRSEPGRLWTTDTSGLSLEQAEAPHEAETLLRVRDPGTANALALWFRAELAPGTSLSVGPADTPTHWGMTTAPLRSRVELAADMVVRAKVRTAPVRPIGTLTRWAIAMPGADWEEHDERSIWGRSTTELGFPKPCGHLTEVGSRVESRADQERQPRFRSQLLLPQRGQQSAERWPDPSSDPDASRQPKPRI
jgi:SAM-dependent methyltransferase